MKLFEAGDKEIDRSIAVSRTLFYIFLFCPLALAKGKDAPSKASSDDSDYVVESRSDGSKVKYKKSNKYDFEGANIDGLYNKPSGSYVSNIKDVKGKSAIRIRENFDAEVLDSARQLK